MAAWVLASQLLLIALSWTVHGFPLKKGWRQPNHKGSFSPYASSHGAPVQPPNVNHPAVSFLNERVYSSPQSYPASSSLTTLASSEASWTASPGWDPVEESTTAHSVYRTSQPSPNVGLLPPPPLFEAGELAHYEENFENGNMERETEELNFMPPPPPYPGPTFQAGELNHYESVFNYGNEERETEKPIYGHGTGTRGPEMQSSASLSPFEVSSSPTLESYLQPVPPAVSPVGPSWYYRFLTGQIPPGTGSHFHSDYETGRDHWDEVHYERYDFPAAQSPVVSTQTKVPSDVLQLPLDSLKRA